MDRQRQWQTGRAPQGVRVAPARSRLNPRLWIIGALGLLGLVLGAIGGLLLYLAFVTSGGQVARAPAPTAIPPKVLTATPILPGSTGAPAVATKREETPDEGTPAAPAAGESEPAATEPGSAGAADPGPAPDPTPVAGDPRVDQARATLRTDEARVGQLLLLGWIGDRAEHIRPAMRDLKPGGIVFISNTRTAADATAINRALPSMEKEYGLLAPLIAIDHEGGLVQRIEDIPNLGSSGEFARGRPSDLAACERGLTHARQLRAIGFNMNLAPVLDVNNNPDNPVIGSRSYGADPELVARLGSAYARGLQGGGMVAVGKHFPGHGNTGVDSHLQLPILPHSEAELERVELVPFRRAIAPPTNLAAIMSAHIVFPAVDPSRAPATLSRPIMTGLLRQKLGFDGLVVSDDLASMKAITDNYTPGQAAVRAIQAGVDLLIIGGDLARQQESRDALLAALATGVLRRDRVDEAVRHVLEVKARFGLLGGSAAAEAGCP